MFRLFSLSLSCLLIALCVPVQAAILSGGLTFNGTKDELRDESVGMVINADADGVDATRISAGDYLQGIIDFDNIKQDITGDNVTLSSVFAVYSFKVIAVDYDKGFIQLGVESNALSDYSIAKMLADAGFSTAGMTNYSGALSDATFAIFEKAVTDTSGEGDIGDVVVDGDANPLLVSGEIGGQISASNEWSLSLVGGLLGDDFYNVDVFDPANLTFAGIANLADNDTFASYRSAMSVLFHGFSSDTVFLPLSVTDYSVAIGGDGASHSGDVITSGNNIITEPNDTAEAGGWLYSDDGNFQINAVPEPASMLVWAGLLGVGGLVAARRRKAAKA